MNNALRRRGDSDGFSFLKGLWALLAALILLGMGHLWLHSRVVNVSCEIKDHEEKLAYLRDRTDSLKSRLAQLQSPAVIKERLKEREMVLSVPPPERVVRVRPEPVLPVESRVTGPSSRDVVILSIAR